MTNPTALWLSGIAIVVTLLGLGVQARFWYLAGPRLTVTLRDVYEMPPQKRPYPAIILDVTNTGRAATSISTWRLEPVNGFGEVFGHEWPVHGPPLPHKLDAQESASWILRADDVREHLLDRDPSRRLLIRAVVEYGSRPAVSDASVEVSTPGDWSEPGHAKSFRAARRQHLTAQMFPAHFLLDVADGAAGIDGNTVVLSFFNVGRLPAREAEVRMVSPDYAKMTTGERSYLASQRRTQRFVWPKRWLWRTNSLQINIPPKMIEMADRYELAWSMEWKDKDGFHRVEARSWNSTDVHEGLRLKPPRST